MNCFLATVCVSSFLHIQHRSQQEKNSLGQLTGYFSSNQNAELKKRFIIVVASQIHPKLIQHQDENYENAFLILISGNRGVAFPV